MRAYIASLSDYNEGRLVGFWMDLEYMSKHEILNAIHEFLEEQDEKEPLDFGLKREEWAVHDWDDMPASYLGECPDWDEVEEIVRLADGYPIEAIEAWLNMESSLDRFEESYAGSFDYESDIEAYFEDQFFELYDIPDSIARYIDTELFTRECFISGDYWKEANGGEIHLFRSY